MAKSIPTAVRELCLSFPQTEEVPSRGSPNFKAAGKTFAIYCLNIHGDGRVALWLHSPEGIQTLYSEQNPSAYFVPPYVGPRGWLGVELNKGLDWQEVVNRVREAYRNVAPAKLASQIDEAIRFKAPDQDMKPEEINPMLAGQPAEVLKQLAERCDRLPETCTAETFGNPVWKAGKKTFVCLFHDEDRLKMQFWVGIEQQALLSSDERYSISKYIGQKGWIDLDVENWINWEEVDYLLDTSYRHFALKRMLKALDG
jgi:predicted DNA-binding protein (MmcQ/YjbR family)